MFKHGISGIVVLVLLSVPAMAGEPVDARVVAQIVNKHAIEFTPKGGLTVWVTEVKVLRRAWLRVQMNI